MSYLKILNKEYEGEFLSEPYNFSFELDSFQKHAISSIKRNENVLVTAHTGSGKTVPAIYAIADSLEKNKKIIYTSPIKSLSNQKLFELKKKFPDVGILTGDIKFNPDAQCVIMTTEILRNILYQQESQHVNINDVDKVIFDEVHYINDPDRGRVWEECIILMPKRITMIMLSATIDKADEFASWIGNIKQTITNLIPTKKRVVPLEHYFFLPNVYINNEKELIKVVTSNGSFQNYNEIKKYYEKEPGYIIVNKLVEYLKNNNLAPALFFVFSRKETEKLARSVQQRLVSVEEASEIENIFNYELRNFRKIYETSPQYIEIHNLLLKGVAYHHSGLVPILKEVIEILFEKGLVKLLFATETFAVGVNAPTKTVVFPKLTKYSNGGFRNLRTDEYLQMAGRAGRRGLDKFGTVIILPTDDLGEYAELKSIMIGRSPSIKSKFRLNYQFILKIINSDMHQLQDFIKMSLLSNDSKSLISIIEKEIAMKKEKYDLGPSIPKQDLVTIKDYISKKKRLSGLQGNQLRKQTGKLNREFNGIKNFQTNLNIYQKYLDLGKEIENNEENIYNIKVSINKDINKMLNYLYDNYYISLHEPFENLPKEQNRILISDPDLPNQKNTIPTEKIKLDLKGIIASNISECNEIILTEIITNNFFLELKPEEIVAVLATFIEEKTNEVPNISDLEISKNVKDILNNVRYIAEDFGSYEYNSGIDIESDWNLYLSFVEPAYDWARGISIFEIYKRYGNIYEGTFIRNILRIYNMIENIKNIAEMCNQPKIMKKLEGLELLLLRDQVTTESLYISKS
jgi:superfamily II RNA helicase